MSVGRRIFYNTAAQTIGKALAVFIGLLTIKLLTGYLGETGFGQYATVLAFQGLFVVLADLGLYMYVVREISQPDTDHTKILSNALGLRLSVAAVSLLGGAVIAGLFPYEPAVKQAMFLAILAFLPVSLNQILVGVFQKHLVQHLLTATETIGRALNLALIYLFTLQERPFSFYVAALVCANLAIFFFSYLVARRYERFGFEFDLHFWKKILAVSWPLVFAVVFNLLYFRTDTIILSWFYPENTVGVYSLPYKILEGLLAFPAMFVGLVMPFLSKTAFISSPLAEKSLTLALLGKTSETTPKIGPSGNDTSDPITIDSFKPASIIITSYGVCGGRVNTDATTTFVFCFRPANSRRMFS